MNSFAWAILAWLSWQGAGKDADPVYAPLWLYQGDWEMTSKAAAGAANPKADRLSNSCGRVGKYFACQQVFNGKISGMVVFIPAEKPGHYYTQSLAADGAANGKGQLEISGDRWTYSSTFHGDGKSVYYRTTNVFTGKDRIHFEQAESSDGRDWEIVKSGEELRVSSPR